MIRLRSASATDVGLVRTTNQDRALDGDGLFAVADGMGGHVGGDVAARTAIEAFRTTFAGQPSTDRLAESVREANHAVWETSRAQSELRGMGTTLTALAVVTLDGKEELALVNVGDSRAYMYRNGELSQLTADHSLVEEMVRSGELSSEEAAVHPQRHILTRALGIDPDVEVDLWPVAAHVGDRILLCSDGLNNELDDEEIGYVLGQHADPEEAAQALVSQARDNGGNDNITVVVVDVLENGDGSAPGADLVASAVGASTQPAVETSPADADPTLAGSRTPEPVASSDPQATSTRSGTVVAVNRADPAAGADREDGPRVRVRGKSPRVTLRVVAFIALLLMILGGIVAAVWWFGERSYYVGLQGNQVAIFKGRPGGLLWFKPSVTQRTGLTTSTVLPSRVPDLKAGKEEPTLAAAHQYVTNLTQEAQSLQPAPAPAPGPGPPAAAPTPAPATTAPRP